MKLFYAPASPFVAKAAMAARHAGLDVELMTVDAVSEPAELLDANPLGKIPALALDDGTVVYDSRLITRHLDRVSGGKLIPADDPLPAELMEAHCDGIADCAVAGMYEKRLRPEEKWHEPWIDKQWRKVLRGLDALPGGLPPSGNDAHVGSLALAAALGYLALRYPGQWEEGREDLTVWHADFVAKNPALAELLPAA